MSTTSPSSLTSALWDSLPMIETQKAHYAQTSSTSASTAPTVVPRTQFKSMEEWLAENQSSDEEEGLKSGIGKGQPVGGKGKKKKKSSKPKGCAHGLLGDGSGNGYLLPSLEREEPAREEVAPKVEAEEQAKNERVLGINDDGEPGDHEDAINWIGLWHEFRATYPLQPPHRDLGEVYTINYEQSTPNRFVATLSLPERAGEARPHFTASSTRKKDCVKKVAKAALLWLADYGYGAWVEERVLSVPKRKQKETDASAASDSDSNKGPTTPHLPILVPLPLQTQKLSLSPSETDSHALPNTPAQRAVALAQSLHISVPQYKLTAKVGFPGLYDGYATISGRSRKEGEVVEQKIGSVRNIYGRKKTKEAVAQQVCEILERLAREVERR